MPNSAAASPKSALLFDPLFESHRTGDGHPECPQRHAAILRELRSEGLIEKFAPIAARDLTDDEALLCHTPAYLEIITREIPAMSGIGSLSTGDTTVCADSLRVARRAAGGVLAATDFVFGGGSRNAFCAVRPPGHHATPSVGMGFCIFNNVAIAARYAQQEYGIERVAIIDWDVHHGNGTQDIFYEDGSVFYFSTHQSPLYPHTGAAGETGQGEGADTTLNRPLPAGSGIEQIGTAFDRQFLPAMEQFKPELVIISAGFDSRVGDPLGGFLLTDADFTALAKRLLKLADQYSAGRLLSVLEGGYNIEGLAKACVCHARTLLAH